MLILTFIIMVLRSPVRNVRNINTRKTQRQEMHKQDRKQ